MSFTGKKMMAAIGVLFLVLTPAALASAKGTTLPDGLERYQGLLDEQSVGQNSTALRGSVPKDSDAAIVLVEALPNQEERAELIVGSKQPENIVAAAVVKKNGKYSVRLDSQTMEGTDDVWLSFLDEEGRLIHAAVATLERNGSSSNFKLVDVESDPNDPIEANDHAADFTPISDDEEYATCWWSTAETGIAAPAAVAVAGTNTTHAKVSVNFTDSASARLDFALKTGHNGNWIEAGGSSTVSNSFSKTWSPSNSYGTYEFRAEALYSRQRRYCIGSGYTGEERLTPTGFTGGNWKVAVSRKYPTWCTNQAAGTITLTSSNASTINSGVKLSVPGFGVDVDSRSGFSTSTKLAFEFTANGKYLCGTNTWPAQSWAGVIMSDYTDR